MWFVKKKTYLLLARGIAIIMVMVMQVVLFLGLLINLFMLIRRHFTPAKYKCQEILSILFDNN